MLEISNHRISPKISASIIVFKKQKISKHASYNDAESVPRRKEFEAGNHSMKYDV